MPFEFTPAAERAIAVARGWTSHDNQNELDIPEVLVGLLAEPECRSALILARHGIDAAAVQRQFPSLVRREPNEPPIASHYSSRWITCLEKAESLLDEYPRPLVLATEHLLLGIVATDNEASQWLSQCGLTAADLEAEVHRISGHQPGPLPLDPGWENPGWDLPERLKPSESPEGSLNPASLQDPSPVLRIVDAAANRASEGLRVIEDFLRFVLDDRHLTALCKEMRHDLAAVLEVYPTSERHAVRDTRSDVGTTLSLPSEKTRDSPSAVVQANFKRVEQSLRSLEEFSKTLRPDAAAMLQQLRYRVYTLERLTDITCRSLDRLAAASLYVLIDGSAPEEPFRQLVHSLISAGTSIIQLRDKRLPDRELLKRARIVREMTRASATLFIVNDRPDLALLADADGVHVGQDELTVSDARRIVGGNRLIGVSTHSLEQARAAVLDGANYIGVGPTFASPTKRFSEFTGVELLRSVAAEIRLPAFAIGGITVENLPQVMAAGFHRIAVSGAIVSAADPVHAARELLALLESRADA